MSATITTNKKILTNHLTGWTNVDFDTFTSSGKDISSAIEANGTYGRCYSNSVSIKGGTTAWGYIQLKCTITVNSGSCPRISYYKNGVFQGSTGFSYSGPGTYNVGYLVMEDATYAMGFINDGTASNFSITNAFMFAGDNCIPME
jgi:hypothetical protein